MAHGARLVCMPLCGDRIRAKPNIGAFARALVLLVDSSGLSTSPRLGPHTHIFCTVTQHDIARLHLSLGTLFALPTPTPCCRMTNLLVPGDLHCNCAREFT
mmetsp:Transcript_89486/g.239897  ORF Transcript_89486/g.239897 Transcript_89486/m.239897 type:complete len:101 (-) Transcript_89486:450-752(-)